MRKLPRISILDSLKDPENAYRLWLGKPCVLVAWITLLLAAVSPAHGSGLTVCWFRSATGVPCLGCGLTRSLSCGIRGMFLEGMSYHPMGLLILALFVSTALSSLAPGSLQVRLASYLRERALFFNSAYLIFVTAFVSFGAVRGLIHVKGLFAGL